MKRDVFWLVLGRGWSHDCTWVGLMGLKMCVGMSHMRCHFKNTTCFGQGKNWEPPKYILTVFSGIAPVTCSCSGTRVFQLDGR